MYNNYVGIYKKNAPARVVKPNLQITPFKALPKTDEFDSFQLTSAYRCFNESAINASIEQNPRLKSILAELKIPAKINVNELNKLKSEHAKQTQDIVAGIIANLPQSTKECVNVKAVKEAALLHDIGKVLIPENILNKTTALNDKEWNIMSKHAELGYEILKPMGLDIKTLDLVKFHHQNQSHSGYPCVKQDYNADVNAQILSLADKYSALRENRSYKESYDKNKCLFILYNGVKSGDIDSEVFKALCDYVNANNI